MYNQYFGQYLLQKGLLTAQQLCNVFQDEDAAKVRLGVLAIDRGWLTAAQAQELHELQKSVDKRFGELAISKGYLSADQVSELLNMQQANHLSLSQAILDRGYLTIPELTAALEAYKRETGSGQPNNAVDGAGFGTIWGSWSDNELFRDYAELFLRNIIRILQVQPVPERVETFSGAAEGWFISQMLRVNGQKLQTGLVLSDESLIELASLYSKEKLVAADELALDATAEFLNLQNGLFCINLSNDGVDTEMLPQKTEHDPVINVSGGYTVSIVIPQGRLMLVIGQCGD